MLGFVHMNYYSYVFIQRCTWIRFPSPLCLSLDLNNWTVITPFQYLNISNVLQTDKPTLELFCFFIKKNFAKLSNLMPCINCTCWVTHAFGLTGGFQFNIKYLHCHILSTSTYNDLYFFSFWLWQNSHWALVWNASEFNSTSTRGHTEIHKHFWTGPAYGPQRLVKPILNKMHKACRFAQPIKLPGWQLDYLWDVGECLLDNCQCIYRVVITRFRTDCISASENFAYTTSLHKSQFHSLIKCSRNGHSLLL